MTANQQTGLRHCLWAWLVMGNLLLLIGMEWGNAIFTWINLVPSANFLPYQLGVLAVFLHFSPLISAYSGRLAQGGLFEALLVACRLSFGVGVALMLIYFLLKDTATSRAFLSVFFMAGFIFNGLSLIFLPPLFCRLFFGQRATVRAVIAGNGPVPSALSHYIRRCRRYGIEFVGYYGERPNGSLEVPYRGPLEALAGVPESGPGSINNVLFFGDDLSAPHLRGLFKQCFCKGFRVQAYTEVTNLFDEPVKLTADGDLNFLTFLDEPLLNPLNVVMKRVIDITISLPVVVFVLPLLSAFVWLGQRQSPGPLLFRQMRYGQGREKFEILKFRSMHVRPAGDEARQASAEDERVFRFGRFLRRSSLDEFPQFINVLRGEMSLVGPRPHLTAHDDAFEKHISVYRSRHFVKPGITGYAQIHGLRGEIQDPSQLVERVRKDIYYVTHWSPRLEIWIVLKTIRQVFFPPRSAY